MLSKAEIEKEKHLQRFLGTSNPVIHKIVYAIIYINHICIYKPDPDDQNAAQGSFLSGV